MNRRRRNLMAVVVICLAGWLAWKVLATMTLSRLPTSAPAVRERRDG